jgi:predicted NAD/FAD-dependent oxidoreductase
MTDLLVVGAGIAGLVAARDLAVGHHVTVIDKGRGVGGRMATRRLGDATFDHGAQFVTTHRADFADEVRRWCDAQVATPWFHGQVGPRGVTSSDGHDRFRGVVSMNDVAKHLAATCEVRRSCRAVSVRAEGGGWAVDLEDGTTLTAAGVVLTAPVPQTLALLDAGEVVLSDGDRTALERVDYEPCLAVMVRTDSSPELGDPGAIAPEDGPLDWIADNQAKGISAVPALTLHAGADASRALWDEPDETVVATLASSALASTGGSWTVLEWSVQRWRYARPRVSHPDAALLLDGVAPAVVCGDAFGPGAKVEGAFESGRAAAAALAARVAG